MGHKRRRAILRQRLLRSAPRLVRIGAGAGQPPAFVLALTGLSTPDSLGLYGLFGGHAAIGFTATASGAPITPDATIWSAQNPAGPDKSGAAATFGTGANPTDYSVADGFLVYLHVLALGAWATRSFIVRRAPGAFAPLVAQTFTENTGLQTYTFAAATGTGLTWAYSLISPPAGVTLLDRTVTVDTALLGPQVTTITVGASDQYPRAIDRTFVLTVEAEVIVPPGQWVISGSTIQASPTVAPPTVSGSSITG